VKEDGAKESREKASLRVVERGFPGDRYIYIYIYIYISLVDVTGA
jgi:hypothetical protein